MVPESGEPQPQKKHIPWKTRWLNTFSSLSNLREESRFAGKMFPLPWQKKHIIVCPACKGEILTPPLWHWEKQPDKIKDLETRFCHVAHPEFLKLIPALTENDWKSYQRWLELCEDAKKNFGLEKTNDGQYAFTVKEGLLEIFRKYGIFALIGLFSEMDVKVLFLLVYLKPENLLVQFLVPKMMGISRSYTSMILKKFVKWRLLNVYKGIGKGRSKGRQRAYCLADDARRILDQDLQNYNFFREAVVQEVEPIAERFPLSVWRKDLLEPNDQPASKTET